MTYLAPAPEPDDTDFADGAGFGPEPADNTAELFGPETDSDADFAKLAGRDPAEPRARRGLRVDAEAFIAKAAERRFTLLDVEAQDQMPDPEWLIEGWLPKGALMVLYGPPSAGKSFISLSLMLSLCTGRPFFGNKVLETGDVVYIAGEGASGIKLRRHAWQAHQRLDNDALAGFFLLDESAILRNEKDFSALMLAVANLPKPPSVIVIDTLARAYDGDENSSQEMGQFIRACDVLRKATGATVIVVHHSGASGTKERGSTALRGAADFTIRIDHEEGAPVRTVQVVKVKDGKTPPPMPVQLLDMASSAVPVRADGNGLPATNVLRPNVPGLTSGFGGGGAGATSFRPF